MEKAVSGYLRFAQDQFSELVSYPDENSARDALSPLVEGLRAQWREVLRLRYRLGEAPGKIPTLAEVGRQLEKPISRDRVRQIVFYVSHEVGRQLKKLDLVEVPVDVRLSICEIASQLGLDPSSVQLSDLFRE